jgi:hypothetical protein
MSGRFRVDAAGKKGAAMGALSAGQALHLPLRLHGVRLGHPVDLLLDAAEWRVLGFDVLCGDEGRRFLPFSTARIAEEQISVDSALMLLEDIDHYRARSRSLRSMLGEPVTRGRLPLGVLRDVEVAADGTIETLTVELDGVTRTESPAGAVPSIVAKQDAA